MFVHTYSSPPKLPTWDSSMLPTGSSNSKLLDHTATPNAEQSQKHCIQPQNVSGKSEKLGIFDKSQSKLLSYALAGKTPAASPFL